MDPGVIALLIPIVAIICGTIIKLNRMWAAQPHPALGGDAESRIQALEEEVGVLRRELVETQERLDFTERMLAQRTEPRRLES